MPSVSSVPCLGCDQPSLAMWSLQQLAKDAERLHPESAPSKHSDPWRTLFKRHHLTAMSLLNRAEELQLGARRMMSKRGTSKNQLNFLDIGCGIGYVLVTLRAHGHLVRGLNAPDFSAPHLVPTWKALQLTPGAISCAPIMAMRPPPLRANERFDVVSGFKMQFHTTAVAASTEQEPAGKHAKRRNLRRWGRHEWEYFLGELSLHHLQPRSMLVFEFVEGFGLGNGGPSKDTELLSFFSSLGGNQSGTKYGELWVLGGDAWATQQRRLARRHGRWVDEAHANASTAALPVSDSGGGGGPLSRRMPAATRSRVAQVEKECSELQ